MLVGGICVLFLCTLSPSLSDLVPRVLFLHGIRRCVHQRDGYLGAGDSNARRAARKLQVREPVLTLLCFERSLCFSCAGARTLSAKHYGACSVSSFQR